MQRQMYAKARGAKVTWGRGLKVLVLYLGKCSPSDFCLSHLEREHKVTLALNDLSEAFNLTLECKFTF